MGFRNIKNDKKFVIARKISKCGSCVYVSCEGNEKFGRKIFGCGGWERL